MTIEATTQPQVMELGHPFKSKVTETI